MIVTKNAAYWRQQLQLPVLDRLGSAPDELITYVAGVNAAAGIDQRPTPAELNPDFFNDVRAAVAEMPPVVLRLLDQPLLGVYCARSLGSSALTDVVTTADGQVVGLVTLIDADAFLQRTANEWASWKENTPFLPDSGWRVALQIATAENDNRKNAIQFLLLHEFGHVLTAHNDFLPDWWSGAQKFKSTEEYSFLCLCWQIAMSGDIIPLLRHDFPHRKDLRFYSNPQVSSSLIPEIYQALTKTGFPSLYAACNAYDDFAESFAIYVHCILLDKPYKLSIFSGDEGRQQVNSQISDQVSEQISEQISGYWSSPRARSKQALLAEFLGE